MNGTNIYTQKYGRAHLGEIRSEKVTKGGEKISFQKISGRRACSVLSLQQSDLKVF